MTETTNELLALQSDVDDFLHAAVHDIRGPLGQVRSLVVLLERQHRSSLNADGQELCALIEAASRRAVEVVESIHAYARVLESPVFETLDADSVVDEAKYGLQSLIDRGQAEVTRDSLGRVHGDRSKLLLLFQELFRNALKFRGESPPRIHCSAQPAPNRKLLFSVSDNGVGIPAKHAEVAFKPLKRLHGRDFEGTGMGLAICRRIVELHGGKIWIEPSPQKGSDLRFTLPLIVS